VNNVKKYNLTISVFAALVLISTLAGADDKYPASDFKPTVVFQDEDAAKEAVSSAPTKSAPAAPSSSDSQYPAANFEPKVLYSDSDYKHSAASPSSASSTQPSDSANTSSPDSASAAAPAVAKEDSSAGYLLGLIVLAVAGFVLFKKGAYPGVAAKSNSTVAPKRPSGLTGVGKYLLKTSGTGVSRYLEQNAKNAPSAVAATGVAKYLASQVATAKETASQAATGVEKYLRDKG
jgi:hypothetical protein